MNKYFLLFFFCFAAGHLMLAQKAPSEEVLKYTMNTKWTSEVPEDKPWNVYPRPQMRRNNWVNLNGKWDYAIRSMDAGMPFNYDGKILVPFAAESALSQVKKIVGEENYLWYRTKFNKPELGRNEKLQLHFGAVDWEATVYLNGQVVGGHKGGYTAFSMDITPFLNKGKSQELIVRVFDPTDGGTQARGKQVRDPKGIWYTPVTGIWQTVWLEKTNVNYIQQLKSTPDIDASELEVQLQMPALSQDLLCQIKIKKGLQTVSESQEKLAAGSDLAGFTLPVTNPRLWSPSDPFLYDLTVTLSDSKGQIVDQVDSYFGMRKIALGKDHNGYTSILLNNEPYFQFGLLDQGWWPDGLYTAPTPEAMMYDVEKTKELGFNMLRKHVKVEPAHYYYECDKMGMLVWQDMPNGNYFQDLRIQAWESKDADRPYASAIQFEREWKEIMDQFHSFPSIVVWVPLNEGWGQYDTERLAQWTQSYDPSRLVDAPSGWTDRGVGDIQDVHLYPGPGMELPEAKRASVLGEFGGLGLPVADHLWWDKRNWGYLTYNDKTTLQIEFQKLIDNLVGLKSWGLAGAIYTQTTDVEGEVNGLMTYDREVLKFDPATMRKALAPLYKPTWNHRVHLRSSEHSPVEWKTTTAPIESNWMANDVADANWQRASAPFSAFDNFFLPKSSKWNPAQVLYLRNDFYLTEIPNQFYLKYYLNQADADLYINGKKVSQLNAQGGRKRHYTHQLLKEAEKYLQKGKNTVAVQVKSKEEDCSFDLGFYSTASVQKTTENAGSN